ncbi:MAG: ABC transporter permease, partial [Methanosarcina sp.]
MKINFRKTVEEKGIETLSFVFVITIWQFVADMIVQNKLLLPSFYDVVLAFSVIVKTGLIYTDTMTSLLHFSIGIAAALILGIPLGIAMGWFKAANRALDPIIEILRPIPPLAWIPFA